MAGPWEKYQGQSTGNPWEKYNAAPPATAAPAAAAEPERQPGQFALQNLIKGSADALGAPGDLTYNLTNLGKAGIGRLMGAAGAKSSSLPQVDDPRTVPLTSGWIQEKMKSLGLLDQQGEPRTTGEKIGGGALQMLGGAMVPVGRKAPSMAEASGAEQVAQQSKALKPGLDKDVALLASEGVPMTPGQIKGGIPRSLEEKAKSYPVAGDAIGEAEKRGLEGFNQAIGNRALAPLGEKVPKGLTGTDMVAYVGDKISAAYNKLTPKLKGRLDTESLPMTAKPGGAPQVPLQGPSLRTELENIRSLGTSLPPAQRDQLNHVIDNEVIGKFTKEGGLASGETLKTIESQLGKLAKGYMRNDDPYIQQMGEGVRETQAALRRMIERENPAYRGELQKLNEGWANLVRLETAGAKVGKKDELITPAMLDSAVKATDPMLRRRGYARGEALMQDLSTAGVNRLAPRVPNSGTFDRSAASQIVNPMNWPGMVGAQVAYSPWAQALMQRQMTQGTRPPMLPPQAAMAVPGAVPQVPLQGQQ